MLGRRVTLKEHTLQAKLRKHYREGKIPHHTTNLGGLEVVQDPTCCIHKNTVAHYTFENLMTEKPPADFMNKVENVVIQFLKRYPNNMVPLGLVCEVNHVSAITGEELDVHLSNFGSQQESVYETTSLEEVYE